MTENVNGIQIDVSAVLGEKIAELAVASIPLDRLEQIAKEGLRSVQETRGSGYNQQPSMVQIETTKKFYNMVSKMVDDLLATEDYQQKAMEEAKLIVKELQEKVHENCVNALAMQLTGGIMMPYGPSLRMNVEQIVHEMMNRR